MSSNSFNFNLPDASPLPDGLSVLEATNPAYQPTAEIVDNKLKTTTVDGNYGALVVYDTGDHNGIVRAKVKVSTNAYARAGVVFRAAYAFEYFYAAVSQTGQLYLGKINTQGRTHIDNSYAIPNFDPNAFYEIEVQLRDENIQVFFDGDTTTPIYDIEDSSYLDATQHGVGGTEPAFYDDLFVGDATQLPLTGNAPTLTVSGPATQTLYANEDPVPVFTVSAEDVEDGDLTDQVTVKGGPITNDATKTFNLEFTVVDSDYNTVKEYRTVEYVTKPILEYTGAESYTITQGQPFKPPVAIFQEENGLQGQVHATGWTDSNRNTIGEYELVYSYVTEEGIAGNEVRVPVSVIERPVITDTGPFSMVQEYGEEYITVDGYELKRFDSPDGQSWAYGFENDVTVPAVDIHKISNETTNTVAVARIKIPFDSLALCESTLVRVDIQTDYIVSGSKIEVAFGEVRDASKYRLHKLAGSSTRNIVEFEIKPYHDSSFRVYGLGNGKDPDSYFGDTGVNHDWHLSTDTDILVYFKFGSTTPAANILAVNAYAKVGRAKFFENGKFFRGKDSFVLEPFRPDDPVNKGLPPNPVVNRYKLTDSKVAESDTHFSMTAGSDWIDVGDTSGVEIGDLVYFGRVKFPIPQGEAGHTSFRLREVSETLTKEKLGYAQYVKEIDTTNSRIRVTRPVLADYSTADEGVDLFDYYDVIVTSSAEIASLLFGRTPNSWVTSVVNGVDKADTISVNAAAKTVVVDLQNYDDLVKFKFDYILPQNNFTAPLEGPEFGGASYGERMVDGEFELPLGADWDATESRTFNYDRNYLFTLPNKMYALHTYITTPKADNGGEHIGVERLTGHDLSQWSVSQVQWRPDRPMGITNSSRASGFNAANMIRKEELDRITCRGYTEADVDADLDVAENAIPHAITGYLAICQMMSSTYLPDIDNTLNQENYFLHRLYNSPVVIVSGGTGYARGDTLELIGPDRLDCHSPTVYTVESVDNNGSIRKAFVTRSGQHMVDPSSANHVVYKTSGNGTGAVFDTTGMFKNTGHSTGNVTVYPSGTADSGYLQGYAGAIPMGAVFTIDPNIDLRAEWKAGIMRSIETTGTIPNARSYEFYAVCCAIKKYGNIICDVTYSTYTPLNMDHRIVKSKLKDRILDSPGTSYSYKNIERLRTMLVPVMNFTPTHHLETEADLKPSIEMIQGENITVAPNWRDPKCYALSPLYGDISEDVTVSGELDPASVEPQEFYYSVTDADGRTSTIGPRTVTVEVPVPVVEAGPNLTLKAGEPFKLQGFAYAGLDQLTIETLEWTQLEGDATSLSDKYIADPTGIAPSAIAAQNLVYQLKAIDSNGLESTDTVTIEVAALEGRSAVNIEIPDAPDGTVAFATITDLGLRTVFGDYVTFNNGVAVATQLPVDAGEVVRGTVDVGNTLESEGTGFKGVTYAI